MNCNIQILNEQNYILINVQGNFNQLDFIDLLTKAFETSKAEKILNILIDISEVNGNFTILERYQAAEFYAKLLLQGDSPE